MSSLLEGVRILDLTRMLAGPYATMLLGDLGAEVIKIEDRRGDYTRISGQYSLGGMGAYFLAINRNKKSVVLDLKHPRAREVFYELVRVSDVVVDNMRPQALDRLGCGYEELKRVNPRIISCSLSGFGHSGPYRDRPAFDLTIQALGGAMSITGEKGGPPVRMGLPMGDLAGGLFAALGIVSALHFRSRTGKGRWLDISLLDCQISLLSYLIAYHSIGGLVPGPQGSRHESIVPYQAFHTKDIWIVVACSTPKFWEGLCRAIGREDLITDDRFDDPIKRVQNQDELVPILEEIFLEKSADEWLEALEREEVPCAPVNTLDRALSDPQVLHRRMVVELEHPALGRFKAAGNPIKTACAEESFASPPLLGEHTEEVLMGLLGYDRSRIQELVEEGVIATGKGDEDAQ
jgi:CoA:oxalate CoA-transferase